MAQLILNNSTKFNGSGDTTCDVVTGCLGNDGPDHVGITLMLTIIIFTIVGNAAVCWIIYKNTSLWTIPNIFILNLAVCDLLTALLNGPFTLIALFYDGWTLGRLMCEINGFLTTFFGVASVVNLAAISVNRCCIISYRACYGRVFSQRNTSMFIAGGWLFSALCALPPAIGWSHYSYVPGKAICTLLWFTNIPYTMVVLLHGVVIPFGIMILAYIKIFTKVRESKRKIFSHMTGQNQTSTVFPEDDNLTHISRNQSPSPTSSIGGLDKFSAETAFSLRKVLGNRSKAQNPPGGKSVTIQTHLDRLFTTKVSPTGHDVVDRKRSKIIVQESSGKSQNGITKDTQLQKTKKNLQRHRLASKDSFQTLASVDSEVFGNSGLILSTSPLNNRHESYKTKLFSGLSTSPDRTDDSISPLALAQISSSDNSEPSPVALTFNRTQTGSPPIQKPNRCLHQRSKSEIYPPGSKNRIEFHADTNGLNTTYQRALRKSRREDTRLTITLLVVVVIFTIAWAPLSIVNCLETFGTYRIPRDLDRITIYLVFLQSALNPVIYGLMNSNFRTGFKAVFCSE